MKEYFSYGGFFFSFFDFLLRLVFTSFFSFKAVKHCIIN